MVIHSLGKLFFFSPLQLRTTLTFCSKSNVPGSMYTQGWAVSFCMQHPCSQPAITREDSRIQRQTDWAMMTGLSNVVIQPWSLPSLSLNLLHDMNKPAILWSQKHLTNIQHLSLYSCILIFCNLQVFSCVLDILY